MTGDYQKSPPRPAAQSPPRRGDGDSNGGPSAGRAIAEIELHASTPRWEMRVPADSEGLPLLRQALRGLGEAVDADFNVLLDAELALTEACSNVVHHAYDDGGGAIAVDVEVGPTTIAMTVRDDGRGMADPALASSSDAGLGLKVIEAVASTVEVRTKVGLGTELTMELPIAARFGGPVETNVSATKEVVARLVGLAAAQADLPPSRITEALMVTELVVRHASEQLTDSGLRLRLASGEHELDVFAGPLAPGAATAIVSGAEVPVVGSVVERLADAVWAVPPATGRSSDGEELALRFSR